MEELNSLSLMDLKELAKMKGISNYSKLKKAELIDAILEISNQKTNIEQENNIEVEKEDNNTKNNNNSNDENKYGEGILEILPDGFGFLRGDNYLSTNRDIYISPVQIKRFRLETGDKVTGVIREPKEGERFPALIYVSEVNGEHPEKAMKRTRFDYLTPIYPNEKLKLETTSS